MTPRTCPFDHETLLPDIVEKTQNPQLRQKIETLKEHLTYEQKKMFNEIDDILVAQITETQQATIKAIHCPACRCKTC